MKSIYRHTIILSAFETIGTRALVAVHYMVLAVFMGVEQFGQISAWYSAAFLCYSIGSSGIMTTLTLFSAQGTHLHTAQQLSHVLQHQWRLIFPLTMISLAALICFTPLYKTDNCLPLAVLSFLLSLAYIAKRQMSHVLKLNYKQLCVIITDITYNACVIGLLSLWYWYYGTLEVVSAMCIFTICTWCIVCIYMIYSIAIFEAHTQKPYYSPNRPSSHPQHIAIDISKFLFSPNALVLLVYATNGPAAAGFIKALHGVSQLFLSSSSKLLNTATHINYAFSADPVFITKSLYWAMLCGFIGITATLGCLYINTELCSYAMQYIGSTAAALALFGTNQVETMLQFSLASRNQSHVVLTITLCALACVAGVVLVAGMPTQMGAIILLFFGARCISLGSLIHAHQRQG